MFRNKHTHTAAFTLIELLVVIAIIGLLSSVIMSSLTKARQKSRHARRLQDMQTLMQALEMYASDHAGRYPASCNSANAYSLSSIQSALSPYIPKVPADPLYGSTANDYHYCSPGNRTSYTLLMRIENQYNNYWWCRMSSSPSRNSWQGYPFCSEVTGQ